MKKNEKKVIPTNLAGKMQIVEDLKSITGGIDLKKVPCSDNVYRTPAWDFLGNIYYQIKC